MTRSHDPASPHAGLRRVLRVAIKAVLPLLILAGGAAFMRHQIRTRPSAQRTAPARQARLVTVTSAVQGPARTEVLATGTVIPAQQVAVSPEVSGRIVWLAPEVLPGGLVRAGQDLIRIDPNDYALVVDQRTADIAKAWLALRIEQGSQTIARQEYELLGQDLAETEQDLVLREPHLKNAQAGLDAAQAALDRARLDLGRCTVRAPFNGVIQAKHVDLGARVSPGNPLVTLVGTDRYWVETAVPVRELQWIDLPEGNQRNGSEVTISNPGWPAGAARTGRVIRQLPDLEPQGRMARLLVAVDDPLAVQPENGSLPAMLLGSYMHVVIQGREVSSAVQVPREMLRDGDFVWIMDPNDQLEIRPVRVGFRGRDEVFVISGLSAGDRLVVTDIAAPVEGMRLRLEGAGQEARP